MAVQHTIPIHSVLNFLCLETLPVPQFSVLNLTFSVLTNFD